jgi:hypothetical protein
MYKKVYGFSSATRAGREREQKTIYPAGAGGENKAG